MISSLPGHLEAGRLWQQPHCLLQPCASPQKQTLGEHRAGDCLSLIKEAEIREIRESVIGPEKARSYCLNYQKSKYIAATLSFNYFYFFILVDIWCNRGNIRTVLPLISESVVLCHEVNHDHVRRNIVLKSQIGHSKSQTSKDVYLFVPF